MSFTVKQETFEGPLDLLLKLIQKEELDITTIALREVTEQYLVRVKQLQRENIPEISDFLVIAARLILIKSRALLAEDSAEEEDDLAGQLAEYKLFKELAGRLDEKISDSSRSFGKDPVQFVFEPQLVTDGTSTEALYGAFNDLIARLPDVEALTTESLDEQVSLEDCANAVRKHLERGARPFKELFTHLSSRLAMIVTFLAVLELIKQQALHVRTTNRQLMVAPR